MKQHPLITKLRRYRGDETSDGATSARKRDLRSAALRHISEVLGVNGPKREVSRKSAPHGTGRKDGLLSAASISADKIIQELRKRLHQRGKLGVRADALSRSLDTGRGIRQLASAALIRAYTQVENGGHLRFSPPLSAAHLITCIGQTQISLPLPNGKQIGACAPLGLPNDCIGPKVISLTGAPREGGIWMHLCAHNRRGERRDTHVLLSTSRSAEGATAILRYFTALQRQQLDWYEQARTAGEVKFRRPVSCAHLVGGAGNLQISFTLPDGNQLGRKIPLGLPQRSFKPALHSIRYNPARGEFSFAITVEDSEGNIIPRTFIVRESAQRSGKQVVPLSPRSNTPS